MCTNICLYIYIFTARYDKYAYINIYTPNLQTRSGNISLLTFPCLSTAHCFAPSWSSWHEKMGTNTYSLNVLSLGHKKKKNDAAYALWSSGERLHHYGKIHHAIHREAHYFDWAIFRFAHC